MHLHGCIDSIRKWCETCPCTHHDDDAPRPCPLNTLRAPECAAGDLHALISPMVEGAPASLLSQTIVTLPSETWAEILADLQSGLLAVRSVLSVKLGFWRQLPWSACVLAHFQEAKAIESAKVCLESWDSLPALTRDSYPSSICKLFAHAGPFREHLQRWVEGGCARAMLPADLLLCISRFNFIPIAERCIEAQHSRVKKRTGFNRAGPVACSLALRGGSFIEGTLQRDPTLIRDLATCFQDARHVRRYALSRGSSHVKTPPT